MVSCVIYDVILLFVVSNDNTNVTELFKGGREVVSLQNVLQWLQLTQVGHLNFSLSVVKQEYNTSADVFPCMSTGQT